MYRELFDPSRTRDNATGLSLCIQGTLNYSCPVDSSIRFIPVYTGNTLPQFTQVVRCSVYPCVYREHPRSLNVSTSLNGLSLCIQGTRSPNSCSFETCRFIPVYTGNTPIITYCFIIKILTFKFPPIF